MIEVRHTLLGRLVSDHYSGYRLGRAFRAVEYYGEGEDYGLPVVMVANHFSWWDGFIQYRLNKRFFGRRLHVMVLEEQLRRSPILSRCGAFSVKRGSRESLESLGYAARLLENPENLVLLFPQGRIESLQTQECRFGHGLGYLMRRAPGEFQWLLNVNLVDYGPFPKPTLTCYYRTMHGAELPTPQAAEHTFNRFLHACREKQRELWRR